MSDRELEIKLPVTLDRDTVDTFRQVFRALKWLRTNGGTSVLPATATPLVESGTGTVGTGVKYAREDHVHPTAGASVSPATATPLIESGAGAVGTAVKYAREDHIHPLSTTPVVYNCDVTLDFTAATYNLKTLGDVIQTLPVGISGPTQPATIVANAGLRATPTNSALATCTTLGMTSGTGLVSAVTPTGVFAHNYLAWAWSQFSLDYSKPFDCYFLMGTRSITQDGAANNCRHWNAAKDSYLSFTTNEVDIANYGVTPIADANGTINGTSASNAANVKRSTANLTDDLWVARISPLRIEYFSKAVAGVMPSTDTLAGFTSRGTVDLSYVNGLSRVFMPGDAPFLEWDVVSKQAAALQTATIKALRVVQRQ